jgi:hypothetical protein
MSAAIFAAAVAVSIMLLSAGVLLMVSPFALLVFFA